MSRIDSIFNELKSQGRTALMPFITAGYPSLDVTKKLLLGLADAGASMVEIGFPFSDPIADGPVIADSMYAALSAGVTPDDIFQIVREVRSDTDLGLIAMVSQSIVSRMGEALFFDRAADSGFDGLIIPDLDVGRAGAIAQLAATRELSLALLVSHLTETDRVKELVGHCRGFVYLLARAGITGEQEAAPEITKSVARLRSMTDLPLAAGFGISRAEHVHAVTSSADAAIVGSALVRVLGEAHDPVAEAMDFVRELASGLSSPSP